ncbi:DUF4365 domain-containing protein [Trichocoleus sp. DQ-A3]|uniref:DUF4365 domain-containing protein n=1 Tax=Cyanophyceae TaxID=3028117 RepID=UPI001685669A|nr:DUF4365 domain-containing protein [Coleofasciculus sp. FACHB-125]MBD1903742.1 DUF4365 domain-containing protein [Coleofasciculus sp. FACHB-125]
MKQSQANINGRRAELIAELFFQELKALFVSQPTTDIGFDLFVAFENSEGGINSYIVQIKATEQPVLAHFSISEKQYRYLAYSNIPAMLLVVDVKRNKLYYAWLKPKDSREDKVVATIKIPVREINDDVKEELRRYLSKHHKIEAG